LGLEKKHKETVRGLNTEGNTDGTASRGNKRRGKNNVKRMGPGILLVHKTTLGRDYLKGRIKVLLYVGEELFAKPSKKFPGGGGST